MWQLLEIIQKYNLVVLILGLVLTIVGITYKVYHRGKKQKPKDSSKPENDEPSPNAEQEQIQKASRVFQRME